MGISAGTQLGTYEIVAAIGEGGMGVVYRARDSKLGRDVAVKALPDIFALDPERLARFDREAQVLAALNHPNLGIIHELKEINGAKYLILELVEGETLAERVERGPIPVDQAVDIALQIARGVQAAHDKGIVHRDLKPANVKITPEGHVKVLDFGLAKIHESAATDQNLSYSPTLSGGHPSSGLVIGTAAYMSPEQARGKELDRRADVWAFGCILFEMLTGRQLFPTGETVSDTLASILVGEPDLTALPAATPPKVRALLERCLRKDERRRLRDIGDARVALEEARSESEASAAAAAIAVEPRRREMAFGVLAMVFALTATGLAARLFLKPTSAVHPVRLDLGVLVGVPNSFYLSPDGRKVAFVSVPQAGARIWVRSLDSAAAEPIPSTDGITPATTFGPNNNAGQNNNLFWSADSRYIGFVAEGKLKKVAATGGPAQELATLPTGNYFGTWNNDDVILVAGDGPGGPLLRVPAGSGGQPTPETELDKSRKEQSHRYPHFLPDGRHYLYLSTGADARDRVVYVGTLGSKDRHSLPGIAAEVKYSSGHLVFVRDGALMAQKFDLKRLELVGDAFTIADRFAPPGALTWTFSASLNGILAYRTSPEGAQTPNAELVWYDRKGTRLSVAAPEGEYQGPELSPNRQLVAFTRGNDIWWRDIERNRQTNLTTDTGNDQNPRWAPDGATIAFDSTRDSGSGIYERAVGVVGSDRLLYKPEGGAKALSLSDWSRDGKYLAFVQDGDVWALPLTGDKPGEHKPGAKPIQVTKTSFTESLPRISPDSRWIAYVSNKTGANEVYIQSFPEPGVEQQVSAGAGANTTTGQAQPRWSRDGKELFYFFGFGGFAPRFMSVSINPAGGALNAAAAMPVFGHPAPRQPFSSVFSVTNEERFLLQLAPTVAPTTPGGQVANAAPGSTTGITLIVDWASADRER
ncbi:MAG TPA: protein kinase [Vicinamibacterales bacterium]|nr:protein kinase [Vicinamibacterales bacterium]